MRKTGLLLIGLIIAFFTNGQIVKIQGGTSISKLDWKLNEVDMFDESLIGYSLFAGIDYFDKPFFNLSSNLGMVRKGGKGEVLLTSYSGIPYLNLTSKPTVDYFSINTTIDFKYRLREAISPFISIGPRFDYLINRSKIFSDLEEFTDLNKTSIGLLLGGGFKYDYSSFQFGLRADYYLDFKKFSKIAEWAQESNRIAGEISFKTFTINLTVGYRLK